MGQINKNNYNNSLTNLSITMQFILSPTFAQYCFYDSAKTIKDKIYLLPSLYQLRGTNPEYVNLTSKSNWIYEWNDTTTSLDYNLTIISNISTTIIVVGDIMGLCPNSFKFAEYNLSMGISQKNWFTF